MYGRHQASQRARRHSRRASASADGPQTPVTTSLRRARTAATRRNPLGRDGYRALLDIARSGNADALVVSDLSVLSPDKVTQEIMLDHLRGLGLTIVSTNESDHNELLDVPDDHTRLVVRDVITKVGEFQREFGEATSATRQWNIAPRGGAGRSGRDRPADAAGISARRQCRPHSSPHGVGTASLDDRGSNQPPTALLEHDCHHRRSSQVTLVE